MQEKRQIVMLPTEKAIENGILKVIKEVHKGFIEVNNLFIAKRSERGNKIFDAGINSSSYKGVLEPQNLYILSNEEIKEGDWYYDRINNIVDNNFYLNQNGNKKIIAATDPELIINIKIKGHTDGTNYYLPKISQDFIEAYIKAYNEDNIIKEVMVEYEDNGSEEWIGDNENGQPFWNEKIELKLRPDNTIIINRIKEKKYTREEVINLIKNSWTEGAIYGDWNLNSFYLEKFTKENIRE